MEERDRPKFAALMATLKIAFREPPMEKKLESAQARLYFEYLSYYPIEKVTQAVDRAIKELKWFPKIAELIDLMNPAAADPSYWPELTRIELKERELSPEEAKRWLDQIYARVEQEDQKEAGAREQRFQDRKKILDAQKKIILGEA